MAGELYEVVELFGYYTGGSQEWESLVKNQKCRFTDKKCFKIRKSDPDISIGTCTVRIGISRAPLIICPNRLLEGGQVFSDCLHLLTRHSPGNQIHLIPEVTIPGGSVDYFLASVKSGKPVDFVGIEFQTMDTTGTLWPARQSFLQSVGVSAPLSKKDQERSYGVNWKHTAKTILVQLHHKVETFETLHRNLVLAVQTPFMSYMEKEFSFGHLSDTPSTNDPMHFHVYKAIETRGSLGLELDYRRSTDSAGIAAALNLGATAEVDERDILAAIERKISARTLWSPVSR
jgi:hypothetical protein